MAMSLMSADGVSRYWIIYDSNNNILPPRRYDDAPRQDIIVENTVEALKREYKFVIVRAGTGSGKSLITMSAVGSYIMPTRGRTSARNRGVVLTPTNALANQYYQDFMRGRYSLVRDGMQLSVAVLFGKEKYQCAADPKVNVLNAKCSYGSYAQRFKCPMYKPVVTQDVYAMLSTAYKVNAVPYECVSGTCYYIMRNATGCKYYDDLAQYISSSIIVTNPWKFTIEFEKGTLPSHVVTAIDEFDSVLMSMIPMIMLDAAYVNQLISRYNMHTHRSAVKLLEYVRNTNVEPYDVFHQFIEFINAAREISYTDYKNCIESKQDPSHCSRYIELIQDISALDRKLRIAFTSVRAFRHKGKVVIVGDMRSFMRNMSYKVLLVSATLLPADILERMGIDSYYIVEGPKRIRGKAYVVIAPTVVNASKMNITTDPEFAATYAKALRDAVAVALHYKPTFIPVHAYWIFSHPLVKAALREVIDVDDAFDTNGAKIMEMRDGKRDVVISAFATRGIDMSYDRCRSVVIPKLPVPDIDAAEIIATVFGERTREVLDYLTETNLYHTISRAIRGDDDWAVIISPDIRTYIHLRKLQLQGYLNIEWYAAPAPTRGTVEDLSKYLSIESVNGAVKFKVPDEVKQIIEQTELNQHDQLESEYANLKAVEIKDEPQNAAEAGGGTAPNGDAASNGAQAPSPAGASEATADGADNSSVQAQH